MKLCIKLGQIKDRLPTAGRIAAADDKKQDCLDGIGTG